MNKVISFISGKEYSLADLFGGDTKIIIPDLQRDYCWGNYAVTDRKSSKTKELVSDFVKNIGVTSKSVWIRHRSSLV